MAKRGPSELTEEHKAALAEGRTQGRVVRRYLDALEANRPRRGRKRTPESIQKRLDTVVEELDTADPVKRLSLIQERMDLEAELAKGSETVDMTELEEAFVGSAKAYSDRKKISYAAWRELGIDPKVLKRAKIDRTRR